jgi:hypothetical protein
MPLGVWRDLVFLSLHCFFLRSGTLPVYDYKEKRSLQTPEVHTIAIFSCFHNSAQIVELHSMRTQVRPCHHLSSKSLKLIAVLALLQNTSVVSADKLFLISGRQTEIIYTI